MKFPLKGNNLEEKDLDTFFNEANSKEGEDSKPSIDLKVGRPISEDESHIARVFGFGPVENFTVTLQK